MVKKAIRTFILWLTTLAMVFSTVPAMATTANNVNQTFTFTNQTQDFLIPDGVYEIGVELYGGEGAWGGNDSAGRPPKGGYKGYVRGTIPVVPGQVLTIAVGSGADDSPQAPYCRAGWNQFTGDPNESQGGVNPLPGFDGGNGGSAGPSGCSGYGGGGGAATVIQIKDSADAEPLAILVAGGSGGTGGSGQYEPVKGRISLDTFSPNPETPVTTNGQVGLYVQQACTEANWYSCDGGGGAGGGGGYVGGARGLVEFGAGSSTEWFGYGAHPGQNWTANISTLSAGYEYYPENNGDGYVKLSFSAGTPSAPSGLVAAGGNTTADLYWSTPASEGLSPITGYRVDYAAGPAFSSWNTFANCTDLSLECTVTGLVNGTDYKFRVAAVNDSGAGTFSALSEIVTPSGPPAAPVIDSVSSLDGALDVIFTPGESVLPILDYEYSLNNGQTWFAASDNSSPIRITGLLNGTVYPIVLRGISAAGTSEASISANGTPSALPGAPTITDVTAGGDGTSLIVSFVGGFNGGTAITDYEYALSVGENTSNFGDYSSAGTTSPFTISELTVGTAYTVQLRAKNNAGYGPGSPYRVGVTLAPPQAPVVTDVTPGPQRLIVSYTAYTDETDGGSAISKIEYSVDGGQNWSNAGTLANPFVVSGLANGQSYNLRLRASNAIGVSPASEITVASPASPPSMPLSVRVVPTPGAATVSWEVPLTNGGAPITGYTASAYTSATGGSAAASCTSSGLSCQITGLTNGTSYFIDVVATNEVGNSIASSPRVLAIPAALPGAPTINSITGGNSFLSVSFSAGTVDTNAPIVGYQFSLDGGNSWRDTSALASPVLISGLTNGTTYNVVIRAVSNFGAGATSNSASGKPISSPAAIEASSISYTAASGSVTINWDAPNDNGSQITKYEVSAFDLAIAGSKVGGCETNGTTSCTINGLSNGTFYYVSIQSLNAVSYSSRSNPRVQVKPGNATSVTLESSAASANVGESVTLTATVNEAAATGTVNFLVGNFSITGCSAQPVTAGIATCVTTGLPTGTLQLRANYLGDSTYSSSISSGLSLSVAAIPQTITPPTLSNKPITDGSFQISATGGASGNPVTFTSATPSVCTAGGINGATIILVAVGTCTINAAQAGNSNYAAAATTPISFEVFQRYVTSFDANGGSTTPASVSFDAGQQPHVLPTITKTSFVLDGWYSARTGGSKVGNPGDSYTPTTSSTLYARWIQQSLWGMGAATKIGTMTTVDGLGTTFTATGSGSNVEIDYEADALPAATVIDVYLLASTQRAETLITDSEISEFVVSLVVAWLASDGTVPDTDPTKPLRMTIENSRIRSGAVVYSILGDNVTELGTATEDGRVTVEIFSDPEIAIANVGPTLPAQGQTQTSPVIPVVQNQAPNTQVVVPPSALEVVLEGGIPTTVAKQKDPESGMLTLSGRDWKMELVPQSAPRLQLPENQLLLDGRIQVAGEGYRAGSSVSGYLFSQVSAAGLGALFTMASTTVELASLKVAEDGTFSGFMDASDQPAGEYILQVNGVSPAGESRSVSIRVVIPKRDQIGWTKRTSSDHARMIFKNPVNAGKVQFVLNGEEIAWVRAIDTQDRKLRKAGNSYYLNRSVKLKPGKNVLEIFVDGERVRRTAYTND